MNSMNVFTDSSVVSMFPFGRSPTRVVSLKLILTLLAAVDVAAPLCGFVASSNTFKEAIACNCVAFSSTLPGVIDKNAVNFIQIHINPVSILYYAILHTIVHWINSVNH